MVYLEGATEAQISAALGIKPVTVRDWKKRSEWSDAVAALREYQQNLVLDRLSLLSSKAADAIEDSLDSDNEAIRLKAAQWVLERGHPFESEFDRVRGSGAVGEVERFMKLVAISVTQ